MASLRNGIDDRFDGRGLKGFFRCRFVADFPMKDVVGLFLAVFAKDRRIGRRGLMRVYQDGELFVFNFDKFGSIGSGVLIFGNDEGDFLRLEQHLARREHHLLVEEQGGHPSKARLGEILTGNDGQHAGKLLGLLGVDALQSSMGIRTADHMTVNHTGKTDVIDVVTFTLNESGIFLPL